jgi:hypothetical protein
LFRYIVSEARKNELVAFYPFNADSQNQDDLGPNTNIIIPRYFVDSSSDDLNVASIAEPVYSDGVDNKRYAADLSLKRIDITIPSQVLIGDEWSFEFWSYLDYDASLPETEPFLSQPDCTNGLFVENHLGFYSWYPDWPFPLILVTAGRENYDLKWTHFAFINNIAQGEVKIKQTDYNYANDLTKTITHKGANLCKSSPLVFAENGDGVNGFLNLKISEFRFWNRVLQDDWIYLNQNK